MAGNDYCKYPGVGPKRAMDFCLRQGSDVESPTSEDFNQALVSCTRLTAVEVIYSQETSRIMAVYPIVYSLSHGQQQHMSGCLSAEEVTKRTTGAVMSKVSLRLVAAADVCDVCDWCCGSFRQRLFFFTTYHRALAAHQQLLLLLCSFKSGARAALCVRIPGGCVVFHLLRI